MTDTDWNEFHNLIDDLENRSSDSAKYTNKSSGTSVLSGNFNTSSFQTKFYTANKHRDGERQSHGNSNLITAPVHKKVVANSPYDSNNHIINRFINNNNTQAYNNHYSLSLNRHAENHNAKLGVGCIGTLTSPYTGNGVERIRGTKSDIGIPLDNRRMQRSGHKNTILHKSTLPSVHSEMSIYDATFKGSHLNIHNANNDIINNNHSPTTSAITFSKTGSKLLYTNKHRLNPPHSKVTFEKPSDAIANKCGPLLYKNHSGTDNGNWKNSVYDNPIRSVSWKAKDLTSSLISSVCLWIADVIKPHETENIFSAKLVKITALRQKFIAAKLFWFILRIS